MQFHVEVTPEIVRSWATNADGAEEVDQALERQGGAGVQRPEEMLRDVAGRTRRMHQLADRIYDRWFKGVKRQSSAATAG